MVVGRHKHRVFGIKRHHGSRRKTAGR
jgi:hypothetical protein